MKKTLVLGSLALLLSSCLSPVSTLQSSFRRISRDVVPSVVQVNVVEITRERASGRGQGPWDFFFPDPDSTDTPGRQFRMQGLGSGVIIQRISSTYYVLTNNHVIGDAQEISITLSDRRMYPGEIVGRDPRRDIAVVSFSSDDPDIAVAKIGNSESLQVGDWVLAIGNPFGLDSTVTSGIISGLHRPGPTDVAGFIQTDASINQGNSGGALVNLRGEVIGINTWIQTPTGGNIGLGFAVPVNSAMKSARDFIDYGELRYGWLGVTLVNPGTGILAENRASIPFGAFITNVYLSAPGYLAGLRPGDLVTELNGRRIRNVDNMIYMLGEYPLDMPVRISFLRKGRLETLELLMEPRKPDIEIRKMYADIWPGFSIYTLNQDMLRSINKDVTDSGVFVISVESRTAADLAGLKNGDIIKKVNEYSVSTITEFYAAINQAEELYILDIIREGEPESLTLIPKGVLQ